MKVDFIQEMFHSLGLKKNTCKFSAIDFYDKRASKEPFRTTKGFAVCYRYCLHINMFIVVIKDVQVLSETPLPVEAVLASSSSPF